MSESHSEAATPLQQKVQALLGLRPGEYLKSAVFLAYLALASAIYITGKTARDTLFLSRYRLDMLPWMFIGFGIVSTIVATCYGRVADRFRRDRLIVATCLLSAASYLGIWIAVKADWSWIYPAFYIWAEVVGNLFVTQFWTYANDLHNARDAKRLFGVIGAGRVLGIVVCGFAISALARRIGTENLILVIVGMMLGIVGFATLIRRRFAHDAARAPSPQRLAAHPTAQTDAPPFSSRYAKLVAAVIFVTFLVCTLADYQFKIVAKHTYTGDELASYFGTLYAVIGGVAFILQFFLTARILAVFGLLVGLLVMPICLLASSAGLALVSAGILMASAMKFSDNAFQYSINEASVQLLYFPFPEAAKGRIRGLLDGAIKPASYALAGVVLLVFATTEVHPEVSLAAVASESGWPGALRHAVTAGLSVPELGIFTLPMTALWIVLVGVLCREYVLALARTLRDRRLRHGHVQETGGDRLTHESLLGLIDEPDEETAVFALERLMESSPDRVTPQLARLLASPHEPVRVRALRLLEERPQPGLADTVSELIDSESARVGAAAAVTYCALQGEDALERVLHGLDSSNRQMRVASLVGLMKHCGLDGVLAAGPRLQAMLGSGETAERVLAAQVLGGIGVRHFYRQLLPLLADADGTVQKAAARAAREIPNPKLVAPLLPLLGGVRLGQAAEKAVAGYGDEAVGQLESVLASPDAHRDRAKGAARALRRIGTPSALKALVAHLEHPDERVRRKILRAAARLNASTGLQRPFDPEVMETRILEELRRAYQVLSDQETVLGKYPGQILEDTFSRDLYRSLDRTWSLLGLAFDPGVISRARRSLQFGTPRQKANALEVLDNSVGAKLKGPLMALLEASPPAEKLRAAGPSVEPVAVTPEGWLETHFSGGGGWHRVAAVDAVGFHRILSLVPKVQALIDDPVRHVREVAAYTLARILGPDAAPAVRTIEAAPDPDLQRIGRYLRLRFVEPASSKDLEGGIPMLTTLEEVVFLRHVSLFKGIGAEDLAALADVTEEAFAPAGEEILRQGELGEQLYMIVTGRVEVLVDGRPVGVLGAKSSFGEMSLIDGGTRSATVRALEPTHMLTLSKDDFHELLDEHSEVASNVMLILCKRIREVNARLISKGAGSASDVRA